MKLFKKFYCLAIFILILQQITYAQDSSRLRISLLTCTPGDELYSIFGHSAIRIVDSNSVTDIVYNYGTFNFDDEGFYLKFIRGKLLYYISIEDFQSFKINYQATNRGITEQVLDLSPNEKINIRRSLNENLKEENKYYKYDFFLDNCTTRLRDLILKSKTPTPSLPAVMPIGTRFRDAIDIYLIKGDQYWSKLGIDLLLGAPTDAVMTPSQQQFLPDNLMIALDNATNTQIVVSKENLYKLDDTVKEKNWFTPMFFFCALLLLLVLVSLIKNKSVQSIIHGLDGLLFFLTGAFGFLLIFMMTATDHSMTKSNYNILWAWPTHAVISFFINSKKRWIKNYLLITAVGHVLILLAWHFLPQRMNDALVPFILLLIYRAISRYIKLRYEKDF